MSGSTGASTASDSVGCRLRLVLLCGMVSARESVMGRSRLAAPTAEAISATWLGEAEREACIKQIQDHFVAGNLDTFEMDERLSRALRAQTSGDLAALAVDLPRPAVISPVPFAAVKAKSFIGAVGVGLVLTLMFAAADVGQTRLPARLGL